MRDIIQLPEGASIKIHAKKEICLPEKGCEGDKGK